MESMTEQELKSVYTRAVIIQAALVSSVVVYVIVAELLRTVGGYHNFPLAYEGSPYEYIRYALLAVAITFIPLAQFIKSAVIAKAVPENIPAKLVAGSVIAGALCDAMGVFGLVLFLLRGNIVDVYVFAVLALIGHAIFFPIYSRWEELVQPRKW